jgi:hypothetical protein
VSYANSFDLENIFAFQSTLIKNRWLLYCESKSIDMFNKSGSGDIINPDDQIYTKSHANGVHKSKEDYYTVVHCLSERSGMNGIRIPKGSKIFNKSGSGDIINPDDQIYTKSHNAKQK